MCNGRIFGGACGAKFSTTPLVSGEIHLFIRWSAHTLGVHMKREGSLTRTPPPPPPSVSSRRAAGCRNEPMAIFLLLGKNEFLRTRTVFAYSGRYRIVGCNRLERVRRGRPTFVCVRVSRAAIYIAVRRVAQTYQTNLGFRHTSFLAPPP